MDFYEYETADKIRQCKLQKSIFETTCIYKISRFSEAM